MDIDQRDIEKGALSEILPRFHPESISYLSELNDYRMYAEIWSNKRSKQREKRREMGHEGYLKTLELGERKKKRKIDRVRFDYFVVANSVDYIVKGGEMRAHIQTGGIQTNSILKKVIEANGYLSEAQSRYSNSAFHSENYLPKILQINLEDLDLKLDDKSNKYYFEIPTNTTDFSNQYQKMILSQILGEDAFFEKLQLLYKVDRKYIRCFFESPEYVSRNVSVSNAISRLCVVCPFYETMVIDFTGTFKDYADACLLGILIKAKEGIVKASEVKTEDSGWFEGSQIDSYA